MRVMSDTNICIYTINREKIRSALLVRRTELR